MGYLLAREGVPPARSGQGVPQDWVPQLGMGYFPSLGWCTPSQSGWSVRYPQSVKGYHNLGNRATKGVLDMRRAVCLLRSRRRTFLFQVLTQANQRSLASKCFAEWGFLFSNGSRDWGCKKAWNSNAMFWISERLFPPLWIQ